MSSSGSSSFTYAVSEATGSKPSAQMSGGKLPFQTGQFNRKPGQAEKARLERPLEERTIAATRRVLVAYVEQRLLDALDDGLALVEKSIDQHEMVGEDAQGGGSIQSSPMALVEWQIEGMELINCNCTPGCPCQFNSLPTHGHCRAHMWMHVERGQFGDVKLDDTRFGVMAAWPGAIHQGNGTHQVFVDDRATPSSDRRSKPSRKARRPSPARSIWFIYAAMSTTFLPTVTTRIDLTHGRRGARGDGRRRRHPRRHGVAHPKSGHRCWRSRANHAADGNRVHRRRVRQRHGEVDAARSRSTSPRRTRTSPGSTGAPTALFVKIRGASPPRTPLRAHSRGPRSPAPFARARCRSLES